MQYLLLIYANERDEGALDPAAMAAIMQEYQEFTKSIVQAGQMKAADRLKPTSSASTVRVRNGKVVTTDGPFAETREQLGGYYLVEAKHLDEALAIAARIPSAKYGSVEVRPIWPAMG
ncbi:MAG TPA: YciI family protein [Steroidobacteraceae bacterium]